MLYLLAITLTYIISAVPFHFDHFALISAVPLCCLAVSNVTSGLI